MPCVGDWVPIHAGLVCFSNPVLSCKETPTLMSQENHFSYTIGTANIQSERCGWWLGFISSRATPRSYPCSSSSPGDRFLAGPNGPTDLQTTAAFRHPGEASPWSIMMPTPGTSYTHGTPIRTGYISSTGMNGVWVLARSIWPSSSSWGGRVLTKVVSVRLQ